MPVSHAPRSQKPLTCRQLRRGSIVEAVVNDQDSALVVTVGENVVCFVCRQTRIEADVPAPELRNHAHLRHDDIEQCSIAELRNGFVNRIPRIDTPVKINGKWHGGSSQSNELS